MGRRRSFDLAPPQLRCRGTDTSADVLPYHLSRREYERAVDAGVFEPDARLELIDGTLLAKSLETPRHAAVTNLTASRLQHAFEPSCHVRVKQGLAADGHPE